MIKTIDSIGNLAVFQEFNWRNEVCDANGRPLDFRAINVIYGRNYSGKTTLSRLARAMETGLLSDKYESPSFQVTFSNGAVATHTDLASHGKKFRVFNEDFVRDNLRFVINPDESVEPFAILGEGNNNIEREIESLEEQLGSKEEGSESGLYADLARARGEYRRARREFDEADKALKKQLSDKATGRDIGIKYKPHRFGDQNYTIRKLEADIEIILAEDYSPPEEQRLLECEKLLSEKRLSAIPAPRTPNLSLGRLIDEAEILTNKRISDSDKIEELVNDAILNRWVQEGRRLHSGARQDCAFCGTKISHDRWNVLEKHFDEESDKLNAGIDSLLQRIDSEKKLVQSTFIINKPLFYSKFQESLDSLESSLRDEVRGYTSALDELALRLKERKDNLLVPSNLKRPIDGSQELLRLWGEYDALLMQSNSFAEHLASEQSAAMNTLRLDEVSKYLATIRYHAQVSDIEEKRLHLEAVETSGKEITRQISFLESRVAAKRRELNDEEKGADKVNEYLNHYFGHRFLSLEPREESTDESGKRVRFEVVRDGKKAYHLSEGERSLLAFCYFLAKLNDTDTRNSKPIIWIDDPISSLDSNHIFFVYSLISTEIVSAGCFEQLFISTHSLDFLKYLRRLSGKFVDAEGARKDYDKAYFVVARKGEVSTIEKMPKHLQNYATEFNYLFHQIHKCASIEAVDDTNFDAFYNFGNNARKFLEIYLFYKYPDQGMSPVTLQLFFGDEQVPAVLVDRINNEYSHLAGVFERGATPVEVPEMQIAARKILDQLRLDSEQYLSLLRSIGAPLEDAVRAEGASATSLTES